MIKVGCCGYPIAREEYYRYFDCIEINITFYQLPELRTAEKWKTEASANFEFIMKAWQLITHTSTSFTYFGKLNYFRLHGTYIENKIDYNHRFTNSELESVLKKCTKPQNYVMFNNSTMLEDALKLKKEAAR